jgi:SAM-dependent methyltransferase
VIPFYGADDHDLFAIERAAMDRAGVVVDHLRRNLPAGVVLDVGAGDGFTAEALSSPERAVVAVEPATGMIRTDRPLAWAAGVATALPLRSASVDAAYATWAYFFTGPGWDPSPGLSELDRVVRRGGPLVIIDNLGGDEFSAMAPHDIHADVEQWAALGFDLTELETSFEFESLDDARLLLTHFFGPVPEDKVRTSIGYRVGAFTRLSRGGA